MKGKPLHNVGSEVMEERDGNGRAGGHDIKRWIGTRPPATISQSES